LIALDSQGTMIPIWSFRERRENQEQIYSGNLYVF